MLFIRVGYVMFGHRVVTKYTNHNKIFSNFRSLIRKTFNNIPNSIMKQ